jgi:hypothetical protein
VNVKSDMPQVHVALTRLEQEIRQAQQNGTALLKIVHGYGSSGAGGDIRIAVQKRLMEMREGGQIRACIFGEHWSKSDEQTWELLRTLPELKKDVDLGRRNLGITVVMV